MLRSDMIVWNSLLPHGTGRNTAAEPRRAMFVCMTPVDRVVAADESKDYAALRAERLEAWEAEGGRARLDGLGRRLLGLEEW